MASVTSKKICIRESLKIATKMQIENIFLHLPLDIVFVDKDNQVIFYSQGEGIFSDFSVDVIGENLLSVHSEAYKKIVEGHIKKLRIELKRGQNFLINLMVVLSILDVKEFLMQKENI